MKSSLKLIVGLALLAYLVFAVTKFRKGENVEACKNVDIEVTDSSKAAFISANEVRTLLERTHLYPEGIPMNKINSTEIEKTLKVHQFILDAECYKTADNVVHIKVSQRLPVMRIISCNGSNFFIDGKGMKMSKIHYPADVVVATGAITPTYAHRYLAPIGKYLQGNDFWNSQIEQLNVLADGTVEMVPRVGNHIVYLGAPTKVESKLNRLKMFYQKVLCKVGWNKYNRIDVEFGNQIVCTKKE